MNEAPIEKIKSEWQKIRCQKYNFFGVDALGDYDLINKSIYLTFYWLYYNHESIMYGIDKERYFYLEFVSQITIPTSESYLSISKKNSASDYICISGKYVYKSPQGINSFSNIDIAICSYMPGKIYGISCLLQSPTFYQSSSNRRAVIIKPSYYLIPEESQDEEVLVHFSGKGFSLLNLEEERFNSILRLFVLFRYACLEKLIENDECLEKKFEVFCELLGGDNSLRLDVIKVLQEDSILTDIISLSCHDLSLIKNSNKNVDLPSDDNLKQDSSIELSVGFSYENLLKSTGYFDGTIRTLLNSLERKQQIILTGAPGTGKTYLAQNLAKHLTSETDGIIETIQLHPAYTYEDFIQGLRPIADENGQLSYQMIPGRFLDFCDRARNRTGKSVLIIDEINRANLASVFGELLYLLEYRNQSIKLAGSDRPFSIPENVYIIGTMNTADRSIALVDHALRRRFAFIEICPDYRIIRTWHLNNKTGFDTTGLINILQQINTIIDDKHYEVGLSFFLDHDLKNTISDVWELEIYPYLEELFYSDLGKIEQFRWENIEAKIRHDQDFSNG
jgi:hypothetical protein